jgi:hypothetical protein
MRITHRRAVSATLVFAAALAACKSAETNVEPPAATTGAGTGAGGANPVGSGGAGPTSSSSSASAGTSSTGSSSTSTGAGGMGDPPPVTPSGHLLLSKEHLAELEQLPGSSDPGFLALRSLVDKHLGGGSDLWHDSPENFALVYLLTKDAKYAAAAYAWEKSIIDGFDVRFDSYLEFGDLMRHAALVLDWCGDALDPAQRAVLVDYLSTWTQELWFDNQGSGWGLADPGNNYHHAFLEGTAFAGYALARAGAPNAQKFIDIFEDRLTKTGGVFDYLSSELVGGDWREGANYGERSKQRLFSALAVRASMGGKNAFYEHPYFAQAIAFALYQVQPGGTALAPSGDLARDSAMLVTASERDYLATAASWLGDGPARRLARWYLDEVAPPYENPYAGSAWKDLVFRVPGPSEGPASWPLSYLASGTGFVNWRSSWEPSATSITLSAASVIDQSHQHHDVGSFVIWQRGWLAMDAVTESKSGLTWSPGAHNGIHVDGAQRLNAAVGGLVHLSDAGPYAYASIDATGEYRGKTGGNATDLMNEVTRELVFVRPGTLVVYDRVAAKEPSRAFEWRLHLPEAPKLGSTVSVVSGGAGLTLLPLVGGALSVGNDADLDGGSSTSSRVVLASTGQVSRFLNVLAVADGAAPSVAATHVEADGGMEGVATGGYVLLFAKQAFGKAATLPFSYLLSSTPKRTHVLANMTGKVAISVAKVGGNTTFTVSAGATHEASAAGLVTFVE